MGLKGSLNFAQEVIASFGDVEDANVYIDNVGAFSTKQKIHLQLLDIILH